MPKPRILFSWSSGKDSAWALHALRTSGEYEIVALLTTLNSEFNRVAMHGVRQTLLQEQATQLRLPLWEVPLPWPCENEQYEALMAEVAVRAKREGIGAVAFGDLFLEDIRRYREEKMTAAGLACFFPLWGRDTNQLASEMIAGGLRATLTCIDTKQLDARFAGREFDGALLEELPPEVDRCGERGEFHSFVHAGPMFARPIAVATGETVVRDGFAYADVMPGSRSASG
jgi:uncharacterized protein (TIGR00290 family)